MFSPLSRRQPPRGGLGCRAANVHGTVQAADLSWVASAQGGERRGEVT
jgi:hypothetical protein